VIAVGDEAIDGGEMLRARPLPLSVGVDAVVGRLMT
jgi:hypothetical protein